MKPSIVITVIICGTLLIVVPYVSSAIGTGQVVEAMASMGMGVNLKADLPKSIDTVCMVLGTLMIAIGIYSSVVKRQ